MRAILCWLALASAVPIAGCGKSDKPAGAVPTAAKSTSGADQNRSAAEVAQQARGELSCPAKIGAPGRPVNAPVDDVLNVRPGLSYEEAMNVVLCTGDLLVATAETSRGFDIKAYGQKVRQGFSARDAEPHEVKTGKQIMQELQDNAIARGSNRVREDLKPGQAKWFVGTMGLPGQERVLSVSREERFPAEQNPTAETVKAALLKKYGAATRSQNAGGQLIVMRWAYDPLGRPITETSPLFSRCTGSASPDQAQNLSPDCGVVVEAMLLPLKANPDLVDRLQVGIVEQAGGYRMLTATEQGLGQADQLRRNEEVQKAAKNAKAPTL